ncbi:hypothetical protein FFD13_11930 [Listeria monocytogenes]|nr:hypothetical protein [Listeria monocytogenes]
MNYLKEINEFYSWLETDETLTPASINLWHALMSIDNKLGWKSPFSASESILIEKTLLAGRTVRKARSELVEARRIKFTKRPGGRAPFYELIPFDVENAEADAEVIAEADTEADAEENENAKVDAEANARADAEANAELCNNAEADAEVDAGETPENGTNAEVDAGASAEANATFNKLINKNNNNNIYSATDTRNYFEQFWKMYPRKKNKMRAETVFKQCLKKHSPEIILDGLQKYVKECEILDRETTFVKHPDTFLRNECFLESFETTAPTKKNFKSDKKTEILPDWFNRKSETRELTKEEQDAFQIELEKLREGAKK